jgi:hypothetical protein
MGTEVSGFQLHEVQVTEATHCAEGGGAVQGASSKTDEPDARDQHGTDGRGTRPASMGLVRLFPAEPNALGVAKS